MNGLVAFAFGAGMLSTVNPCGFALLPAFLAYNLGSDNAQPAWCHDPAQKLLRLSRQSPLPRPGRGRPGPAG